MVVGGPRLDEAVVHGGGLLKRLVTGGVVVVGVVVLGTLGSRHQVEDGIVAVAQLGLGVAQIGNHALKLVGRHVVLVVQHAAVAHDEDLVVVHAARRALKGALGGNLHLHLAPLVLLARGALPGQDAVGLELRGGLGHRDDLVAQAGEGGADAGECGGLASADAAGDDDLGDGGHANLLTTGVAFVVTSKDTRNPCPPRQALRA